MVTIFRDAAKKITAKIESREKARVVTVGYLKSVDGNVTVPRRPNHVWFQEWAQPESAPLAVVFNDAVPPIANLPVLVTTSPTPPFQRKVIGVYHDGIVPTNPTNIGQLNLPLHAPSHQYISETNVGHDPVLVWQAALQMLKTTAASGLTVLVSGLVYHYNLVYYYFNSTVLDLTTSIPGAGLVRYTLVYLDPATGLLGVVDGTPVLDNGAIPIPLPDLVADTLASAYVQLSATTTTISNSTIVDARAFLTIGGGDDNPPYTPNNIGDILISLDGTTFEPRQILTDALGEIVTDSNGHLVVI